MLSQENNYHPVAASYDRIMKYVLPLVPKKLQPNHVTFFRLLGSPILLLLLLDRNYKIGLALFVVLAFTDMLDGSMARLRNQITDWGKIWDPIADKLLIGVVVATLLLQINLTLTLLLLAFEAAFVLGSASYVLVVKDFVPQADVWGKIKMNLHCVGAGLLMIGVFMNLPTVTIIAQGAFYASLLFAAISLLSVNRKNMHI